MFLIIISVLFNYYLSNLIQYQYKVKKFLFFGILTNISILIIFKYINIIFNFNQIFNKNLLSFNLIFPLALSFYTLQQITYLVDRYQNLISKFLLKDIFYMLLFSYNNCRTYSLLSQVNDQWNNILKTKNICKFLQRIILNNWFFVKVLISQKFRYS